MWLFTTRGFYSAVQHRKDPNKILVRARNEEDIRQLRDLIDVEPFRLDRSDYEWRVECTVGEWAAAVAQMATEVDYDNFKSAISRRQGHARSHVYMKVWGALLALERKARPSKWKATPAKKSKGKNRPAGQRRMPIVPLCNCWVHEDTGDYLDHDIDCPYAIEAQLDEDEAQAELAEFGETA